jgi:hypothetical protein
MSMDSYIVRVVRREKTQTDRAAHLDGVVEEVESGTRQAFHNADELWAILGGVAETDKPGGGDTEEKTT